VLLEPLGIGLHTVDLGHLSQGKRSNIGRRAHRMLTAAAARAAGAGAVYMTGRWPTAGTCLEYVADALFHPEKRTPSPGSCA
jgi:hypothetical protein